MKKYELLQMLETRSSFRYGENKVIFERYYPQICAALESFADRTKLVAFKMPQGLSRTVDFDNYIRRLSPNMVEAYMAELLHAVRAWSVANRGHAVPARVPDGAEQARMRADIISRTNAILRRAKAHTILQGDVDEDFRQDLRAAADILEDMILPRTDAAVCEYNRIINEKLDQIGDRLGSETFDMEELVGVAAAVLDAAKCWQKLK